MKQQVLITGISKGIGKALAEIYAQNDYAVIGTCRNPKNVEDKIEGVTYEPLDMNDRRSIDVLAEKYPHIDILINNAGQSQISPSEEIPIEEIDRFFDLNIINIIYMTNKFIPCMRERKKGTIVNMSSMQGKIALPFCSIYSATKHALEGYSKGIFHELSRFGVKVMVISPGFVKTTIKQKSHMDKQTPYKEDYDKVKTYRDSNISKGVSVKWLARSIFKIIGSKKGKMTYVLGGRSPFLYMLVKLLPERTLIYIFRKILKL